MRSGLCSQGWGAFFWHDCPQALQGPLPAWLHPGLQRVGRGRDHPGTPGQGDWDNQPHEALRSPGLAAAQLEQEGRLINILLREVLSSDNSSATEEGAATPIQCRTASARTQILVAPDQPQLAYSQSICLASSAHRAHVTSSRQPSLSSREPAQTSHSTKWGCSGAPGMSSWYEDAWPTCPLSRRPKMPPLCWARPLWRRREKWTAPNTHCIPRRGSWGTPERDTVSPQNFPPKG